MNQRRENLKKKVLLWLGMCSHNTVCITVVHADNKGCMDEWAVVLSKGGIIGTVVAHTVEMRRRRQSLKTIFLTVFVLFVFGSLFCIQDISQMSGGATAARWAPVPHCVHRPSLAAWSGWKHCGARRRLWCRMPHYTSWIYLESYWPIKEINHRGTYHLWYPCSSVNSGCCLVRYKMPPCAKNPIHWGPGVVTLWMSRTMWHAPSLIHASHPFASPAVALPAAINWLCHTTSQYLSI